MIVARLALAAGLVVLAACTAEQSSDPTFYRNLASPTAGPVDAETAASMISGYRANNGLSPVAIDPGLMQAAEAQARAMAARDKLDHNVIGELRGRLAAAGYQAKSAVENVGAGYHTLAEAFSGWRDSPPHRQNMLMPGAARMGIAAAYAPGSKYKVYWALILASAETGRS